MLDKACGTKGTRFLCNLEEGEDQLVAMSLARPIKFRMLQTDHPNYNRIFSLCCGTCFMDFDKPNADVIG
jgi:hypothetical protein